MVEQMPVCVQGFRKLYAQNRYTELCAEDELDDAAARDIVAQELGHGRRDVTYAYVPRRED